jgi:hypothetical protein
VLKYPVTSGEKILEKANPKVDEMMEAIVAFG